MPRAVILVSFRLRFVSNPTASLSLYDSKLPGNEMTYTLDRATAKGIPVPVAAVDISKPRVLGNDGDRLVLLRGQGAAFFTISR